MVVPLLFPVAAASMSTADFEFTAAVLRGEWNAHHPDQRAVVLLPPSEGANRFAWALEAERMALNWSWTSRYEVARPSDSSTFTYTAKEPPRQWDEATSARTVVSQSRTASSNLLIIGMMETPHANLFVSEVLVGPGQDAWQAGSETGAEVSTQTPVNTQVRHVLPADHLQVEVTNATMRFTGDFSIAVWDATVRLNESGSWKEVDAGRTETPVTPNLREADYRLLWIHATNATLFVDLHGGPARVASPQLFLEGSGVASFQGSKGVLSNATWTYAVDREPMRVTGTFDTDLSRSSGNPRALLKVADGRVDVGGALVEAIHVPNAAGRTLWPWAWAVLALIPMVWMGARRLRPVTIDEVEWAILAGHDRRGLRLARRLVNRTPTDPDAVFLYGTTMLARGQLASLVRTIEPLSLQIRPKDRRGIAFVLAVAAHGSNDARRARRWAKEAAHDPLLREQLEKQGILGTRSSFLQSGYA